MKSVISYPDRGHWGSSKWRGNCSGHVIVDLIKHFKPSNFVDVCEGSGTSGDVCRELNIPYVGLDLHKGNDYTLDSVLGQLPWQSGTDFCFSHPAYHNMITYQAPSGNNHSKCQSVNQFLEMSEVMLMNQRQATKKGGHYATLIGDMRKNGSFWSFQSDFINMMPKDELLSVTIKMQHNCVSDNRVYSGSFVPIMHEYLLIWKRSSKTLFAFTLDKANALKERIATSWRTAIRIAMMELGGKASLDYIYSIVESVAENLIKGNQHWKAKVRQVLQKHYTNVQRGVWSV